MLSEADAICRLLTGALLAGEQADPPGMHRHVFKVLNPPRAIGWWRQVRFGFKYPMDKPACNPAASFAFYSDATSSLDGPHMRITVVPSSLISLVAFGLTLSGSAAAQPAPYPTPAPPPAGYPPPAPMVTPGQPYTGPDGLTYVNGAPVYFAYGAYVPLVFIAGLGWGYYGPGHHWFGAPGPIVARLDRFYPGGRGFAGGFHGRPGDRGFRGGERDFGRR